MASLHLWRLPKSISGFWQKTECLWEVSEDLSPPFLTTANQTWMEAAAEMKSCWRQSDIYSRSPLQSVHCRICYTGAGSPWGNIVFSGATDIAVITEKTTSPKCPLRSATAREGGRDLPLSPTTSSSVPCISSSVSHGS